MDLITQEIKASIAEHILDRASEGDFLSAAASIMSTIALLHKSIPDKKRISYGIHSVIKDLGAYLYDSLTTEGIDIFSFVNGLFELKDLNMDKKEDRIQAVALKVLAKWASDRGNDFRKTLPYFVKGATSDYWEVREHVAGFFRMVIKVNKDEIKPYLLDYVQSDNPNLRRMISESLRPVADNRWLQKQPDYSISILRHMFAEKAPYPRSSIGNSLSDLARRNPELVYSIVEELVKSGDKNSKWIAARACRNLVKTEPIRVMDLLGIDEYQYKDRKYYRRDYQ